MQPADLAARLGRIATATLANALDDVGVPDQVILGLPAAAPDMRFAGPAVTVREETGPVGTYTSADFKVGAMIDAAGPGDVIVVAAGGAECSTWGGMASLAAKVKGVAGLVVDGGVRDRDEMIEFGFPVFARHMLPTTGRTRLKVTAIGEPVEISGVTVAPGDIIVADSTGVLAIPAQKADEVLRIAEALAADDAAAAEEIRAGLSFSEAMAKFKRI